MFLCNTERILKAPDARREALLAGYQAEAARRYGEASARDMAASMRTWIAAKWIH